MELAGRSRRDSRFISLVIYITLVIYIPSPVLATFVVPLLLLQSREHTAVKPLFTSPDDVVHVIFIG